MAYIFFLCVCLCVYDLHAQGNRRDAKLTTHTEILEGEHVLFGVVKWKLDAQLYTLLARYVCDLHARARAGSTYR